MEFFILIIGILLLGSVFGGLIADAANVRWIVFIRGEETHLGLYEAYKAEMKDIVAARNVSYIGALVSYYTVKNRHKWEK